MMNIDVRSLLERMNVFCTGALEGAAGLCVSRTHYEVTVEHYLSRLLEETQSDMALLLKQADVDVNAELGAAVDRGDVKTRKRFRGRARCVRHPRTAI